MSGTNPQILAISSTVAVGHVGLSAILPTLNLVGRTAAAIPTISLSNHPGFADKAGVQAAPDTLAAMIDAIAHNGWLGDFQTILTGYLPSAAHAAFARTTIARIRKLNPSARYICDPVLGDDPQGLYIDPDAAAAIRDQLVPLADTLLPNRFELAWLSGQSVTTPEQSIAAARTLPTARVIAKSIPIDSAQICNIDIRKTAATSITVPRLTDVPNGTGDMFSALIAADWPLDRATAALQSVIRASIGEDHLAIVPAAHDWLSAAPLATIELP